jgi:hypothetical protein
MLTQERLREVLNYDPESGLFTWKLRLSHRIKIGDLAGNPTKKGYLAIRIDRILHLAHRLAWLHVNGHLPERVEHRDRNRQNNAIDNLRLATQSQNLYNVGLRSSNKSGVIGVHFDSKRKKWVAQIRFGNTPRALGRFETLEEAATVRRKATEELHGDFAYFRSA